MDQTALVSEQIDDGQKLINELLAQGFDVKAAAWVKPTESDDWLLYLVSQVVDEEGLAAAYRALHPALQRLGFPWILLANIKLIGPSNPIAADILDIQRRFPAQGPTRSRRPRLGEMAVDETYVYAPPVRPEEKWRGISVMMFPEPEQSDGYCVEFWPRELQAAIGPGGQPQRVPRPARVWVEGERVTGSAPRKNPCPIWNKLTMKRKLWKRYGRNLEKVLELPFWGAEWVASQAVSAGRTLQGYTSSPGAGVQYAGYWTSQEVLQADANEQAKHQGP